MVFTMRQANAIRGPFVACSPLTPAHSFTIHTSTRAFAGAKKISGMTATTGESLAGGFLEKRKVELRLQDMHVVIGLPLYHLGDG
jgi:hypothetical protein